MTCVIFGGSGFIGQHFSLFLLENKLAQKIVLVDLVGPELNVRDSRLLAYINSGEVSFICADVRNDLVAQIGMMNDVSLIVNLAAVHREPGHEAVEYFETNLKGAENVCSWSTANNCDRIVFTSSIAPYGPTEQEKTEQSLPVPVTPYGASKLAAEKIHMVWQAEQKTKRKLVIVRPGVVFGAGEGGNVTRLIKATNKGYFFYMGNKNTRKAGVYVKELCSAMYWVLDNRCNGVALFNMSMNPGPTIEEYVNVICDTASIKRFVPSVPFWLLYFASSIIDPVFSLLGVNQPISPVRIKKLVKSNNIVPAFLASEGYEYKYTFKQAMADWRKDKIEDWS